MIVSEWHDIVLLGITMISLLGCFYTIALIILVTPKSMSEYRWFLLFYTVSDTAFSFVLGIVQFPKFLFPGTGWVMQGIGRDVYNFINQNFGVDAGDFIIRLSFMIMTWFIVCIITTQDYCLIYRFTVVYPNQGYHDFLVRKKVVFFTIIVWIALCMLFSVPCFMIIPGTKELPDFLQKFEKRYPGVFNDVTSDAVIIWLDEFSGETALLFALFFCGFIVSEIVAISSVFVILKVLRKNAASFSAQTYKLHRQLTFLLIIQIVNPFIFIIFPIIACLLAVIFTLEYQRMTGVYGLLFMSFYSMSNTILTVGFVTPYRQFTKKYVLGILFKLSIFKKYQTVAPVVPILSITGTSFINSQLIRNQ